MAPNDDIENDRLDLQHHLCTLTLEGKLFYVPKLFQKIKFCIVFWTLAAEQVRYIAKMKTLCQLVHSTDFI